MSFLKELFGKSKDSKYGKGHKLGTAQDNVPVRPNTSAQQRPVPSTSSMLTANEASRKAAEAALMRAQTQKNPQPKVDTSKSQINVEKAKIESQQNDYDKALKLKEHYFSDKKMLIDNVSSCSKHVIYFKSYVLNPNERYSKNEIDNRIEMALLNRIEEDPIMVSCGLLFTANQKNEKLTKCTETLNKIIDNIINSPNEEKYRKLRVENNVFKEKVFSCKYADMVLTNSGFKKISIPKDTQMQTDNDVIEEEAFFVYDGSDIDKLNSLKVALSCAEPILPELDRDLKIFRISDMSCLPDIEISEDFYNPSIDELRNEQRLRNEALEKSGMLRTKQMRERDEKLELRIYNFCMIRVRFSDNYILQATFKSNEKYKDLLELVQDSLEDSYNTFDLFGHSLKKSSDMNSTLAECGLAPSALLEFRYNSTEVSHQNTKFLKKSLIENSTLLTK